MSSRILLALLSPFAVCLDFTRKKTRHSRTRRHCFQQSSPPSSNRFTSAQYTLWAPHTSMGNWAQCIITNWSCRCLHDLTVMCLYFNGWPEKRKLQARTVIGVVYTPATFVITFFRAILVLYPDRVLFRQEHQLHHPDLVFRVWCFKTSPI